MVPTPTFRSILSGAKAFWAATQRARVFGMAAEMAFWLFLSIVPLAIVAGLVFARIAVRNVDDVMQALAALPTETRDLLTGELRRVASWHGGAVGAPAAVVFLWLASNGAHAVFDTLEVATHVRRPWWKKRLLAISACMVLPVIVALLGVIVAGADWLADILFGSLAQSRLIKEATRWLVGPICAVGVVAGIYFVGISRRARRQMPVLPGALVAVALQFVTGLAYKAYLSELGVVGAYQAGLTAIAVTLTALYLFATALLVGIQLNVHLRRGDVPKDDKEE
jgi:membrane protein